MLSARRHCPAILINLSGGYYLMSTSTQNLSEELRLKANISSLGREGYTKGVNCSEIIQFQKKSGPITDTNYNDFLNSIIKLFKAIKDPSIHAELESHLKKTTIDNQSKKPNLILLDELLKIFNDAYQKAEIKAKFNPIAQEIIKNLNTETPLTTLQNSTLSSDPNNKILAEIIIDNLGVDIKNSAISTLIGYPTVQEAMTDEIFSIGASIRNATLLTKSPALMNAVLTKFLTVPLDEKSLFPFHGIVNQMSPFRQQLIDLMIKKGSQDLSQNEISLLKMNEKLVDDIITAILKENDFSKVAKLIENPSIKAKLVDTLVKSSGLSTNEEKLLSSNESLAFAAAKAAKENSPLAKNIDVIEALKREKTTTGAILTSVINNHNIDFLNQKIKTKPKYKGETVLGRITSLQSQIYVYQKKENFSEMITLLGIKPGSFDYNFILAGFNDRPDDKKAAYAKELFNFFRAEMRAKQQDSLATGETKINTKKNIFFERDFGFSNPLPTLKKKVENLEIKDTLLTAAQSFKSNIAQKLPNVKIEPVVFLKKIKTTIQGAIGNIHISPNIIKKEIEKSIMSHTIKDLVKKSNINIGKWKVQNLKCMVDKFELLDENKLRRFTMEKINKAGDQVKIDFAPIRSLTLETALIAMDAIKVPPIEINSGNIKDIEVLVQAAKDLGKIDSLCLSDETKKRFSTEFPDIPSATELNERVNNNQKNER